ncbi:MAG: NUDIX hydrolase [Acidimicrobiia bacterium]|nr:NUDIX hydrolase [Acidimicrobiia bacterium]
MAKKLLRRESDYLPTIWAAGAAVYRMRRGRPEILLTHRPRYDDWSLPKGKLDRGEGFRECAEREVQEESGVTGVVEDFIGTVGYVTGAGNKKAVRYWLLQAKDEAFKPNREVDKIRWFPPKKAMAKATYSRDEAIITSAVQMAKGREPGTFYLVRHADAGNKKKWRKADVVRPISKKGQEQVESLTTRLVRTPVTNVISSPSLRCEQTVAPLAARLGLHVETAGALRRESTPEKLTRLIRKSPGRRTVLCSHGETIGPFIERLAEDPKVDLRGPMEWPKGSVWVLTTRRKRVIKARYIPPA